MTPLDVVVRILNNQLSSLMWIDEKVRFSFIKFKLSCCLVVIEAFHML